MKKVVLEQDKSVQLVSKFALAHGLAFYDKVEADDDTPGEVIWTSEGAKDRLHRIDDQFCQLVYLIIEGEREDALTAAAADELDGLTTETLAVAMHGRNDAALTRSSIAALGVLAPPQCNGDYLDAFRWVLHHKDAAVREAAIAATGYAGWPELVAELERIAADDPEPALRDYARIAIEAISGASGAEAQP